MKAPTPNRFSSLFLPRGRTLANRVLVPPMASGTASLLGEVTNATLAHYKSLANSGAGLVIVEYTFVHPSGRSEENQLSAANNCLLPGLKNLARTIQQKGALAGIQLTHAGGKSSFSLAHENLMAPSAVPTPVKDRNLETPREMSEEDILLWKKSFSLAIARAVSAGFDLVEIHAAHGYGLNQWLSPITNHRADDFGQTLIGRSRLLREIVAEARRAHPHLLLSVRIPGSDGLAAGLSSGDSVRLAQMLEECGVDLIHVSSGIGGWKRPLDRRGEGYLVAEAEIIQAAVTVPVIGVGGIETGGYIDQSLRDRKFSLAAVGRAILKDPSGWKARQMCRC